MNLRYLKEDRGNVELMTGKKGLNKKNMGNWFIFICKDKPIPYKKLD